MTSGRTIWTRSMWLWVINKMRRPSSIEEAKDRKKMLTNANIMPTITTGHYTAMVWSNTKKVGCGVTEYKDGKWFAKLYTCNYGPAGNESNCRRLVRSKLRQSLFLNYTCSLTNFFCKLTSFEFFRPSPTQENS